MFKITKISLFVLTLLLGTSQPVFSEASHPSEEEVYFLSLINEARKDPLGMAEYMGLERAAILQDLPQLEDILTGGLPPLKFDPNLYEAAAGHTAEMLTENYYAHNAMDGRTYGERIREAGYLAAVSGESLGMLTFQNFIEPEEAVEAIFKSLFLEELDPATQEERNILNPDLTEAGIALGSGPFNMNGFNLNAYLTTLNFGRPVADTEVIEKTLLGMLNAARRDPGLALLNAGVDQEKASEAYGKLGWALERSVAPLAWDETLYGTATDHNRDMRNGLYFDTLSLDGLTPFDRIASTEYDPAYVGESLCIIVEVLDPGRADSAFDVAHNLYEKLIQDDVDPESNAYRNVFDPFKSEIGISVETDFRYIGEIGGQTFVYVLVADFAEPVEERAFVVGTVYEDHNKNGVVDENEGISALKITLQDSAGQEMVTESGPAGDYQMSLKGLQTGTITIWVKQDGNLLGVDSFVLEDMNENVMRDIRIALKAKWAILY